MKDSQSLKWIIKNSKKQIPRIVFLSISNIILALVGTALAVASKYAIDAAQKAAGVARHSQFIHYRNIIILFGIIIFLIIVTRLVVRVLAQSLTIKVQAGMEMSMRSCLFHDILIKDYQQINIYHSGELMNRMTSDIKIITDGVANIIPNILYCVTQFLGAFIVLIVFDWKFTILFIVAGVIMSLVTIFFRKKLKGLHKKVQETDGEVRSFFQEAIESLLVVKTFGVEDEFEKRGDKLQKTNYDMKMKRRRISILANSGFSFVFNGGYVFALIWCALRVCTNAMTYGTLTAVLQLVNQIQTPFVNITQVIPQYYSILASAERIIEIQEITEEDRSGVKIDSSQLYNQLSKISFENIKFYYDREVVLEQGNAYLNKGEFVAIRGISGIGKSTLMKMLLGVFKPQQGMIKLIKNDNNYLEASPDTRRMFSYVPQGNYLFSGTLRENVKLINSEASDDEIKRALEISEIYDFVCGLPDGLDTVIGEKGTGISEGQAQRLAIARALLSKASVILLDEATSALDEETEKSVLENIKSLNEKTCIIITHKKAALNVCDREFVIKNKILSCIEN